MSAPALLLTTDKITVSHRSRDAYVYVRQSTPSQMVQHTESLARHYELRERAVGSARDTMPARLSTFAQVARQPIRKEAAIHCTAGSSSNGDHNPGMLEDRVASDCFRGPRCRHVAILGAAEDGKPVDLKVEAATRRLISPRRPA